MERLLKVMLILAFFSFCTPSVDYKKVRAEVVKQHDQVMIDNEIANQNKNRLDRMLLRMDSLKNIYPDLDTSFIKKEILRIGIKLSAADLEMENWMKEFDAELGQKTNAEAVEYFEKEKVKLRNLGDKFKEVLRESGDFLRQFPEN